MKIPLFLTVMAAASLFAQTPSAPAKPKSPTAKPAASAPTKPATKPAAAPKATPPAPSADPAPAAAVPDDKVVLTVGNEKVTAKQFEAFVESIPEQYREQARGPMKRQLAEQIVRLKILASEARQRGLDKDAAVQWRIAMSTENLLASAAFNDILEKTSVDDAAVQKYYDEHKNEYERVDASYIPVKFKGSPVPQREGQPELTEEEALAKAQAIRKRLTAGEDFAAIAKTESDDAGSATNGGSLGSFTRGQMVPAFEQAAFTLPVEQVSEPIKTQFGYHLIRVSKHETKDLASVRAEIEQKLKPEIARKSVEGMRQTAPVVMDDGFFGPEKPQAEVPAASATVAPGTPAPAVSK